MTIKITIDISGIWIFAMVVVISLLIWNINESKYNKTFNYEKCIDTCWYGKLNLQKNMSCIYECSETALKIEKINCLKEDKNGGI